MKCMRVIWLLMVSVVAESASVKQPKNILGSDVDQIEVLQQTSANIVSKGPIAGCDMTWQSIANKEGGNCGYHALYNVLTCIELLQEGGIVEQGTLPNSPENLFLSQQKYTDFLQGAVPVVCQSGRVTWLDGQQIENIYVTMQKRNSSIPFVMIEYIESRDSIAVGVTKDVLKVIQHFVQVQDGAVAFIWNVGARERVEQMGGAHWVASVAVKKNNVLRFYYMNSAVGALDSKFYLVKSLFTKTPEQLQTMIDMLSVKNVLNDIEKIKSDVDYLKQKNQRGLYPYFIGCLEYEGPYIKDFSLAQLQSILPSATPEELKVLNKAWNIYNQDKNYSQIPAKNRLYCLWSNLAGDMFIFEPTVANKEAFYTKRYDTAWLKVMDQGTSVIALHPDEIFANMIDNVLNKWPIGSFQYQAIQKSIVSVLVDVCKVELDGYINVINQGPEGFKRSIDRMLEKFQFSEDQKNQILPLFEQVEQFLSIPIELRMKTLPKRPLFRKQKLALGNVIKVTRSLCQYQQKKNVF